MPIKAITENGNGYFYVEIPNIKQRNEGTK